MKKKRFAAISLILSCIMIFAAFTGCAAETPYMSVNGEDVPDDLYTYYLRAYMSRMASVYSQTDIGDEIWEMNVGDGITAFDLAIDSAEENIVKSFVISQKFDEYGLTWGDEEDAQLQAALSGVKNDALEKLHKNSIKKTRLGEYLSSRGENLDELITSWIEGATVTRNEQKISKLKPSEILGK